MAVGFVVSGRALSQASQLPQLNCIYLWELACLR